MTNRHRRPSFKTIAGLALVLVIVLVLGYEIRDYFSRTQPARVHESEQQDVYDRFLLTGVDYTSYHEGEKIYSLQAEEIAHRKRKVGPLTLNPIKEIELTKVKIEVNSILANREFDQDETEYYSIPFQQMLQEVANDKEIGFVSRVIINELNLILTHDGEESLSLSSERVVLNTDASTAQFQDGFLAKSGKDELFARSAVWNNDSREFWIEESYVFTSESGVESGAGGRFAIDRGGKIIKK